MKYESLKRGMLVVYTGGSMRLSTYAHLVNDTTDAISLQPDDIGLVIATDDIMWSMSCSVVLIKEQLVYAPYRFLEALL